MGENHTQTGKSILANDPHLMSSFPGSMYRLEILIGGDKFVIGVTPVGVPIIAIGRNRHAAWSTTISYVDNCDFYKEKIDKDKYFHNGTWKNFQEQRKESIKIKGRGVHNFTVNFTHHGPVIDKILNP